MICSRDLLIKQGQYINLTSSYEEYKEEQLEQKDHISLMKMDFSFKFFLALGAIIDLHVELRRPDTSQTYL
jgi:hypothetical protein